MNYMLTNACRRRTFLGGFGAAFGSAMLPATAFAKAGEPIMRFGVASDVHINVGWKEVGRQGDVVLRQADYGGKSYFYVVNTDWKPVTVELRVPEGTRNLVTGDGLSGNTKLALGPYELKSFAAPFGKPKNLSGESR